MIDLSPESLQTVTAILQKEVPNCEVRVFGSRVTGKATKYSDLDLALVSDKPLDWRLLETLKDSFSESNLPITVDLLDWHSISSEFKAVIEKNYEVISLS